MTGYVADDTAEDGSIRAIYTSFVTTLSRRAVTGSSIFGGDPRISNPTMIKWDNFAAGQCAGGGSGDAECFATLYGVSSAVGFGALLGSLSEFANSTIFICVGASFAVLVCVTLNVIVALYATLTVALVTRRGANAPCITRSAPPANTHTYGITLVPPYHSILTLACPPPARSLPR